MVGPERHLSSLRHWAHHIDIMATDRHEQKIQQKSANLP